MNISRLRRSRGAASSALILAALMAFTPFVDTATAAAPPTPHHNRRPYTRPRPTFDPTKNDIAGPDDPIVRQIAIDALGTETAPFWQSIPATAAFSLP